MRVCGEERRTVSDTAKRDAARNHSQCTRRRKEAAQTIDRKKGKKKKRPNLEKYSTCGGQSGTGVRCGQ